MYSMPVERITSTMKSEPARPPSGEASLGTSVSMAICCAVGRSADGTLAAPMGGAAAWASGGETTVVAAPATATPARNFRRLTSGRVSFRAIWFLPLHGHAGGLGPRGRLTRSYELILFRAPKGVKGMAGGLVQEGDRQRQAGAGWPPPGARGGGA